jgi:glycine/D-amino acid oxidase-like deaminating enzyme
MASAALYAAAGRGQRVIGFDRFEPAHSTSSSFGESRVIRLAYFEDPSYVPLLRGAYRAWREFEAATGEKILTITGIIEAGDRVRLIPFVRKPEPRLKMSADPHQFAARLCAGYPNAAGVSGRLDSSPEDRRQKEFNSRYAKVRRRGDRRSVE